MHIKYLHRLQQGAIQKQGTFSVPCKKNGGQAATIHDQKKTHVYTPHPTLLGTSELHPILQHVTVMQWTKS